MSHIRLSERPFSTTRIAGERWNPNPGVGFFIICLGGWLCAKEPFYLEKAALEEALKTHPGKLLWHQWTPLVGLREVPHTLQSKTHNSKVHPAHRYRLHSLAPKQGKGVRVAFIDTGIAADVCNVEGIPYHQDIRIFPETLPWQTNIIGPKAWPAIGVYKSGLAYIAGHGTHTMGIVAAQGVVTGFAPQAYSFMIKACHDNGTTTVQNLIKALNVAVEHKAVIVNISLKINSYVDRATREEIEGLFAQIPYVVVPAGNGTENPLALFKGVTFSVGAYDYDLGTKKYTIPSFALYSKNYKPLVLAPGVDIVSTGVAPGRTDGVYVVADGTSAAAACVTGFLALLLGELGPSCHKKMVLEVIQQNCQFLEETSSWYNASHWGVIDMRAALWKAQQLSDPKGGQI